MKLEDLFERVKTKGMECWDISYFGRPDSLLGLDYVGVAVFDDEMGKYLKSIKRKGRGKKLEEVWNLLNTDLYVISVSYKGPLDIMDRSYFTKRLGDVYELRKDEKRVNLRTTALTGFELRTYRMMMKEECFHTSKNNINGPDKCPVTYLQRTAARHVL